MYAIIFINAEEQELAGSIYKYDDAIYVNIDDPEDVRIVWKGQKKHRRDYIITNCDREVHIFSRKNSRCSYIYRGIIQNNTFSKIVDGNVDNAIPDSFMFQVNVNDNLPIPYGSITARLQTEAAEMIGLRFNGQCQGIYKAELL